MVEKGGEKNKLDFKKKRKRVVLAGYFE